MSGRIPRQFIDDLLVRVDIVDLIDSHVPLKKSGSNFVARCPFHVEKTPSFSVNRHKQIYHCFGCGVSGNAITFLMEFSHLGFVEAVEDLALFVGIDVPREGGFVNHAQEKLSLQPALEVLDQVAHYYAEQLNRNPAGLKAQEYLRKRGVADEVIKEFQLGYAPSDWGGLAQAFDRNALIEAGMLVVTDDGKAYDRFRGRLMFPIRDRRKRIVGFGGRVLDDSVPKYLNSPETPLFSKSNQLYGLSELLQRNGKPDRILVVEGYMDVIALAQFGVSYAVATLGTATSKSHIDSLFRLTSEIVFCFDGDNAGRKAAAKAVDTALACMRDGRQVKVILLPQGQDPDSLIRYEGLSSFEGRILSAQVLSDYFFENMLGDVDRDTAEGRANLLSLAKPALEKIPEGFFREIMFARLREITSFPKVELAQKPTTLKRSSSVGIGQGAQVRRLSLARKVIALLLQNPQLAKCLEQQDWALTEFVFSGAELFHEILRVIALEKPENSAMLLEAFRGSEQEKIVNTLVVTELDLPAGAEEGEFLGALHQLFNRSRDMQLSELISKERSIGLSSSEKGLLLKLLKEGV